MKRRKILKPNRIIPKTERLKALAPISRRSLKIETDTSCEFFAYLFSPFLIIAIYLWPPSWENEIVFFLVFGLSFLLGLRSVWILPLSLSSRVLISIIFLPLFLSCLFLYYIFLSCLLHNSCL